MKCVVVLKAVEELTLQQMSISLRHRDTRTRAAGLLMPGGGLKARAIAAQPDRVARASATGRTHGASGAYAA
jgi:hypothetical protein